jgi:hypothetical protein
MDWTRKVVLSLLSLLTVAVGPSPAAAADATMYELYENMSVVQYDGRTYRRAWSAIKGTARPGTLLCPLSVTCSVNGVGQSSVDVATGQGTVSGQIQIVVQGDNPVDGPEAVVLSGKFGGTMNFSPALLVGLPYGTVVGTVKVGKGGDPAPDAQQPTPFTGIFHLPFTFPDDPSNTSYYLSFTRSSLTGLQPSGVVPVRGSEKTLDEPMVKFEICLGSGPC